MKKKLKVVLLAIFILGLIYVSVPGPTSIDDFPAVPNSTKSNLDGDTWQNPNLVAYFSNFRRDFITQFYKNKFAQMYVWGFIIPPIRINHPPEYAYQYIRDQQESTFLEEYVYPLRSSIFVNGYEPAVENEMNKKIHSFVGDHINYEERYYESKNTLRFYPSNIVVRLLVYTGIWVSILGIYKVLIKELR